MGSQRSRWNRRVTAEIEPAIVRIEVLPAPLELNPALGTAAISTGPDSRLPPPQGQAVHFHHEWDLRQEILPIPNCRIRARGHRDVFPRFLHDLLAAASSSRRTPPLRTGPT